MARPPRAVVFLCFVSRFVLRFSWFDFAFQLVSVGSILRFILFQLVAKEGLRILQLQQMRLRLE